MENVYKNWKETGYAWEQYDSVTGKGQRTAHFLGWTSLVVNMMSMPETVSVPVAEKVAKKAKSVVEEVVEEVKKEIVAEPETKPLVKEEL